jgi:hypothetical protein
LERGILTAFSNDKGTLFLGTALARKHELLGEHVNAVEVVFEPCVGLLELLYSVSVSESVQSMLTR